MKRDATAARRSPSRNGAARRGFRLHRAAGSPVEVGEPGDQRMIWRTVGFRSATSSSETSTNAGCASRRSANVTAAAV